jgi:putative YhdH/YhfP family quinone oxidoreductase
MPAETFQALLITESSPGHFDRAIVNRSFNDLPPGEVLVKVLYSSLNYKDALSALGNRGVTRQYPHTPGIDAAGMVAESSSGEFRPGQEVIVSGYDLGMNTPGGFGQYVRVPAAWVMKKPANLTLRESMIYGTAGFTAAQSVMRIQNHPLSPDQGKILVTGATGGVGSMAVAILAKEGYRVTAVTGKPDQKPFLIGLGAREILPRETLQGNADRMLLREKWAGVIDTVGGELLTNAIKSAVYGGAVTCCGNVASPLLSLNVYPFILRGITLYGIDSANCGMDARISIWRKLADEWKLPGLDAQGQEITLAELDRHLDIIIQGKERGRVIINLWN